MLVFRVVDKNGDGMYRSYQENAIPLWDECCDNYDDDYHHPSPGKLGSRLNSKGVNGYEYIFGFATVDQLHHWIFEKEWRNNIDNAGGRVLVFETRDLVGDEHQVTFRKETAVLVDDISILELENGSYLPKLQEVV